MRIAVATTDGASVSQHFGHSTGFIVFETEGTQIKSRELRTNGNTPHAQGICRPDQTAPPPAGPGAHSHTGVAGLLGDCEMVLCGGMGAGAAEALRRLGIKPLLLSVSCTADEAVAQYLAGTITPQPAGFCQCQH
jgi:predicted Fe-Mo cluster-binding NifX family protein